MAVKYRVHMVESERGWGREYFHRDFDNIREARAFMQESYAFNAKEFAETKRVPDYYVQPVSDRIEAVEVEDE